MKAFIAFLVTVCSGCGYTIHQNESRIFQEYGIRKIFIEPLNNNSGTARVDYILRNNLIKTFAASGRVVVTEHREDADATLYGTLTSVVQKSNRGTRSSALKSPLAAIADSEVAVSTEYYASLAANFQLVKSNQPNFAEPPLNPGYPVPTAPTGNVQPHNAAVGLVLWGSKFSQSKVFQGNPLMGPFGTTTALVNGSEFDRALQDLTREMSRDVVESVLETF